MIYDFTPTEQAARDIASALRGIRSPSEAPRVIVSHVLRVLPDDDDALTETWFEHASRPHELPAKCSVKFATMEGGAVLVDVAPMMAELTAEIERCRGELNPEMALKVAA